LVSDNTGPEQSKDAPNMDTPLIQDDIYHKLPSLLRRGCEKLEPGREKDVFLSSAIAILSGCFSDLTGLYDRSPYAPNLYCLIVAPAASGKGVMKFANILAQGIHNHYLELSKEANEKYKRELKRYREKIKGGNEDMEEPVEPPFKVFIIPANASSAAVINHLKENEGEGIICETEADSMNNALKQDWGGYSDLLRKSYHHEKVSSSRKTNREYVEIQKPRLSIVLSGTYNQILNLIMSAEDGLFSRFFYYVFRNNPKWRDVSPGKSGGIDLTVYYEDLAREVLDIHLHLKNHTYNFNLTSDQWNKLNQQNEKRLNRIINFVSEDASSIVFRLGLIQFRICMVLSLLRHLENGVVDSNIVCEDVDFEISEKLSDVYLEHSIDMFNMLPKQNVQSIPKNLERFYNHLPDNQEFTNQEAVRIGEKMGVSSRSVVNYLKKLKEQGLLVQPLEYGPYKKP
jgi:hypothetical protein